MNQLSNTSKLPALSLRTLLLLLTALTLSTRSSISLKSPKNYFKSYYNLDGETKTRGSTNKDDSNSLNFESGKWIVSRQTGVVAEWLPNVSNPSLILETTMRKISKVMLLRDYTSMKFYEDGTVVFGRASGFYTHRESRDSALEKLDKLQESVGLSAIQKVGMMNVPISDKWENLKWFVDFHADALGEMAGIPISKNMSTKFYSDIFEYMGLCLYNNKTYRLKDYSESMLNEVKWDQQSRKFNEEIKSSLSNRINARENGSKHLNQMIQIVKDLWQPGLQAVIEGYYIDRQYCMPDSPISRAFDMDPSIKNYKELVKQIKKFENFKRDTFVSMIQSNKMFGLMETALLNFFGDNWGSLVLNVCSSSLFWTREKRQKGTGDLWNYIFNKTSFVNRALEILVDSVFALMKDRVIKDHLDIVEGIFNKGGYSLGDKATNDLDDQFVVVVNKLMMFSYVEVDKDIDSKLLNSEKFKIFEASRRNLMLV